MADQRLSQERRLLRIVGDKARPTEQSESIHSAEPPMDRTRRHAFNRKPEGIPQGGSQEGSNQPIFEVVRTSHGWGVMVETGGLGIDRNHRL